MLVLVEHPLVDDRVVLVGDLPPREVGRIVRDELRVRVRLVDARLAVRVRLAARRRRRTAVARADVDDALRVVRALSNELAVLEKWTIEVRTVMHKAVSARYRVGRCRNVP